MIVIILIPFLFCFIHVVFNAYCSPVSARQQHGCQTQPKLLFKRFDFILKNSLS